MREIVNELKICGSYLCNGFVYAVTFSTINSK